MADEDRTDEGLRRGDRIPGKGFDAGAGYGGAGNDSAYRGASNYRRDRDAAAAGDLDTSAFDGREGEFDRDTPLGGERREPGR
jgi:hypothetical protein